MVVGSVVLVAISVVGYALSLVVLARLVAVFVVGYDLGDGFCDQLWLAFVYYNCVFSD